MWTKKAFNRFTSKIHLTFLLKFHSLPHRSQNTPVCSDHHIRCTNIMCGFHIDILYITADGICILY
jgi:hypothetical protein